MEGKVSIKFKMKELLPLSLFSKFESGRKFFDWSKKCLTCFKGRKEVKERREEKGKSNNLKTSLTYNAERVIGNGSFGVVYQARVAETGECVAIKKVYQDKWYKNWEL